MLRVRNSIRESLYLSSAKLPPFLLLFFRVGWRSLFLCKPASSKKVHVRVKKKEEAMKLQNLTNTELLTKIKSLAQDERETVVDLLIHLVEVDNRSLYLNEGYSSLFDYLVRALKFSSSAAGDKSKSYKSSCSKT